ELELWSGRTVERSSDRGAADAADQECADDPVAGARRADAARRRRDPPDPGRQQQRLQPGLSDQLVRLAHGGSKRRDAAVRPADDRLSQGASRTMAPGL